MTYTVEVVLRDRDAAVVETIESPNAARDWTEFEAEDVLRDILRAIDRAQNPDAPDDRPVVLRGFSWIVEPSDDGVVIAIEIPMGAAVAGPFDADQKTLDALITRALKRQGSIADPPATPTVH
ncbi:MAG: hypothetical protein M3Q55_17580 [Acidobacteriota bacterium]|nr:hypothetical protein [Acidobacteriota bacterium]